VRNPLLIIGASLMLVQAAGALLAPLVAPFGPNAQDILARLKGPYWAHLLGTDNFGRDTLSRILFGYQTLFAISIASVLGALVVGGSLGVIAAHRGGWPDRIIMRAMDVLFAFPIILLAIGIIATLGPGAMSTGIAIGVVYVPIFARTLRAPGLVLRESDYVAAARTCGSTETRIILRHLLPNLAGIILVQTSLSLSTAILVEASLSFLGLGTQPPTPSLGRMLAESRNFLTLSPWPAIFSGAAILLASLGFNLLGDGLQDRLDPRQRG
jgi:peptide/nickel transport system permease protein